jgi:hypothetical protein
MESIRQLEQEMLDENDIEEAKSRLKDDIIYEIQEMLQMARDGRDPTDNIIDELGDYHNAIKRSKDLQLHQAYDMVRNSYDSPPQEVIATMKQALTLLGVQVDEDMEDMGDTGITPPSQTGGGAGLGSMGGGAGPTGGGGQYPPGTAPTMPESLNHKGNEIMENVDKDVAAMLASLKKYDVLKESCAPVLMARPKPFVAEEEDKKEGNPWEKLASDKKDDKKPGEKTKTHKGGEVTKTEKGLVHKAADKKDKVDEKKEVEEDDKEKVEEGADQDVLTWMKRFASLGNMKGYGR